MEPEIINIETENAPLKIKGGKHDSALLLGGQLIQFTFLREIGSTWRYQVAKGIKENELITESKFKNFVKYGHLSNDPLEIQFNYILQLLSSGKYQVEIINLVRETGSIEINTEADGYYCFDTYGGMVDIIETQSGFDESIAEEYVDIIKSGQEPIAILLKTENSDNTFLIDGHHKFAAYGRLKLSAKCLLITKLNSDNIETIEGLEFLKIGGSDSEYKNRFLESS